MLDMELPEQVLNLGNDRLDLDDNDCLRSRVISEQVDAAALAEVVEAGLRYHDPAGLLELPREPFSQAGVVGIAQPPQLRSAVAGVPAQSDVERGTDAPNAAHREGVSVSALQEAEKRRAHSGAVCQIRLSPPRSVAQRADDASQVGIVHRPNDLRPGRIGVLRHA